MFIFFLSSHPSPFFLFFNYNFEASVKDRGARKKEKKTWNLHGNLLCFPFNNFSKLKTVQIGCQNSRGKKELSNFRTVLKNFLSFCCNHRNFGRTIKLWMHTKTTATTNCYFNDSLKMESKVLNGNSSSQRMNNIFYCYCTENEC